MTAFLQLIDRASPFFAWLWRSSWQAAVLAGLVLVIQWMLGRRLSARWRYNLWLLVILRLVIPAMPASPTSIYNLPRLIPAERSNTPVPARRTPAHSPTLVVYASALGEDVPAKRPDIGVAATVNDLMLRQQVDAKPKQSLFSWRYGLLLVWVVGALVMVGRLTWASLRLSAAMRRLRPVRDSRILQLLEMCKQQMGVRGGLPVVEADAPCAPALVGLLWPKLVMPSRVLQQFSGRELRLIFLHELGHLHRQDVAMNWLMSLLQALHWFNPVLWLAFGGMRSDRELACDELVLSIARQDERMAYGQTMIKLLQSLSRRTVLPGMVGILEGTHPMRRRIKMIAQFDGRRRWTSLALVAALGLAAVTLTDRVKGQDSPAPPAGAAPAAGAADPATPASTAAPKTGSGDAAGAEGASPIRTAPVPEGPATAEPQAGPAPTPYGPAGSGGYGRGGGAPRRPGDRAAPPRGGGYGGGYGGYGPYGGGMAPGGYGGFGGMPPGFGGGMAGGPGMPGAGGRMTVRDAATDKMNAEVEDALRKRTPDINFQGIALRDVVEFLRDTTGLNIYVDWKALEGGGIGADATISLRLKNVTLADALRLILRDVGPNVASNVENGIVVISLVGGPAGNVVVRAYDVSDLVNDLPTTPEEAKLDRINDLEARRKALEDERAALLAKVPGRVGLPNTSSLDTQINEVRKRIEDEVNNPGPAPLSAEQRRADDQRRDEKMQQLVSLINDTVAPYSGATTAVRSFKSKLIVTTDETTHKEIAKVLGMLREQGPAERDPRVAPARR